MQLIICVCQARRAPKITSAVHETLSCRGIRGDQIRSPLESFNTIVLWWFQGPQRGPQFIPHDAERRQSERRISVVFAVRCQAVHFLVRSLGYDRPTNHVTPAKVPEQTRQLHTSHCNPGELNHLHWLCDEDSLTSLSKIFMEMLQFTWIAIHGLKFSVYVQL